MAEHVEKSEAVRKLYINGADVGTRELTPTVTASPVRSSVDKALMQI